MNVFIYEKDTISPQNVTSFQNGTSWTYNNLPTGEQEDLRAVAATAGQRADSAAPDYSLKHSLAQTDDHKLFGVHQHHVTA